MKNIILVNANLHNSQGGAGGYVSRLKNGIELLKEKKTEIDYVYLHKDIKKRKKNNLSKKLKKVLFPIKLWLIFKELNSSLPQELKNQIDKIGEENIATIHCHRSLDLIQTKKYLSNSFKGKLLLTLHNPVPPSNEICEELEKDYGGLITRAFFCLYRNLEVRALKETDILVLPCKEAVESYKKTWKEFELLYEKKEKYFLLTGTDPYEVKIEKEIFKEKHKISREKYIVSYVGRHNWVKGYDLLKKAAKLVIEENKNIIFLIGGKEEPLEGLKSKNWIEIGWTRDPGSLVNASDLFILPNRETYFDLVALEVMSLNKKILASNTGGNNVLNTLSKDVKLFQSGNEKDLARKILNECENKNNCNNREVYKKNFTPIIFAENYIKLLNKIK